MVKERKKDISPDFLDKTKITLAQRVNYHCSRCYFQTAGPASDERTSLITGEAAHINGAKPGSARWDPGMTNDERRDISNGVWLCRPCHKKIDTDWKKYSSETILGWKRDAETKAELQQDYGDLKESRPRRLSLLPQRWSHETTEDPKYIRRFNQLRKANALFNDSSLRLISITGVGGSGKTSFVGNWLKKDNDQLLRSVKGLFYWSFYVDKRVENFLRALINYLEENFPIEFSGVEEGAYSSFLEQFQLCPPIILVLDGLEVLQHALSDKIKYGQLVDAKLRDFLQVIGNAKEKWMCIITSRFPVQDLLFLPAAKEIRLDRLADREGEELLYSYGVWGVEKDRIEITRYLEGHPLALRIFSASLPESYSHNPRAYLNEIFKQSERKHPFEEKLHRLLSFYAKAIGDTQNVALQALSLFRSPMPEKAISTTGKSINKNIDELSRELWNLRVSGLVVVDKINNRELFSCHPIIRDYFRSVLFNNNKLQSINAINLISDRPDSLGFEGVTSLEPIVLAIENLLELREASAALDLFMERLEKGKIFLKMGLPKEGMRVFDAFLRGVGSRQDYSLFVDYYDQYRYRNQDAITFLTGATEFAIELGEYTEARSYAEISLSKSRGARRTDALRNLSKISFCKGNLDEARLLGEQSCAAIRASSSNSVSVIKYVLALYFTARTELKAGRSDPAGSYITEIKAVQDRLDVADTKILLHASKLYGYLYGGYKKLNNNSLFECEAHIDEVIIQNLSLEARILIVHCQVKSGSTESAISKISKIYEESLNHNYQYYMCYAQILIEYTRYKVGEPASLRRLGDCAALAQGAGMLGLYIDALWCKALVLINAGQTEEGEELIDDVANLAGRTGYATYGNVFPSLQK